MVAHYYFKKQVHGDVDKYISWVTTVMRVHDVLYTTVHSNPLILTFNLS